MALQARNLEPRPVVADVDQLGVSLLLRLPAPYGQASLCFHVTAKLLPHLSGGVLGVRRADAVSVSSSWLQERFGGDIIVHARDELEFDPSRYDREQARESLGIVPGDVCVMFVGTPMRHKGIDLIEEAIRFAGVPQLVLATNAVAPAGADRDCRAVRVPPVTLKELPSLLVAADIIALPQKPTRSTRAQMPAKLFDAMAMGVPVVTTDVSDMKRVLNGGGIVVPMADAASLGRALASLALDGDDRMKRGLSGRLQFLEHYAESAVRPRWYEVVQRAEAVFADRDDPSSSGR